MTLNNVQQTAGQQHIRVLVVDDSSSQRHMLIGMLESDPMIEVVAWASNGLEAIQAVKRFKPDLVTMDLRMPVMDGLLASEHIMRDHPTPILMVTGSISRSNQHMISQALNAGVLGILAKPNAKSLTAGEEFVRVVKGLSQVRLRGRHNKTLSNLVHPRETTLKTTSSNTLLPLEHAKVIGIVASTGGPPVLEEILSALPKDFEIPILVVQHIAAGFAQSLVDWLSPLCHIPIRIASPGSKLESGITIASGEHLTVRNGKLATSLEPPVSGHRPSGTVLFRSLAAEFGSSAVGVVLTGMGNDGAVGLSNLKNAGGTVIAQDKSSSVIHSMPVAAINLGIVDAVLNPSQIAATLSNLKLEQPNRPA